MLTIFHRTHATAAAKGSLSGGGVQIRSALHTRIVNNARLGLKMPCTATLPTFCLPALDERHRRQANVAAHAEKQFERRATREMKQME
jgi:hypothetical protein